MLLWYRCNMPEPTMSSSLIDDLDEMILPDRATLQRLCRWKDPTRYQYQMREVEIPQNMAAPGGVPTVQPLCGVRFTAQGMVCIYLAQLSFPNASLATGALPLPPQLDLQFRFGAGACNVQYPDPVTVPAGAIPFLVPRVGTVNSKIVQVSGTPMSQFEIWGCASAFAGIPARPSNVVRATFLIITLPDPGCCELTIDVTPLGFPPGP